MCGKRGQLTVFIILAIVILSSAALYFHFRKDIVSIDEDELIIDPEIKPVKDYVENCMILVMRDLLDRVGMQAGYLTLPMQTNTNPKSYLRFDTDGLRKIPYWYYNGENHIPEISDIEYDLSREAQVEIINCLDRFSPLENVYGISAIGDISIDTERHEDAVVVRAAYPIDAKVLG